MAQCISAAGISTRGYGKLYQRIKSDGNRQSKRGCRETRSIRAALVGRSSRDVRVARFEARVKVDAVYISTYLHTYIQAEYALAEAFV